jgi:TolB protein
MDREKTMGDQESAARWLLREELGPYLNATDQIYPNAKPIVGARSAADDTCAQAELRADLQASGFKICYQSRRDGNSELYLMDADGSSVVNITGTADVDEIYPHVSRDGQRVCFTVVRTEKLSEAQTVPRFDVYWMNMNDKRRRLVASDATDPCWDPCGDRIAFVRRLCPEKSRDYENTGLFSYNIRTGETEELAGGKIYHAYVPCWSPAGDWIVATVHEYAEFEHAIAAIDLRNGQIHPLTRGGVNGCRPDVSWDGKFICWNPNDVQIGVARFNPGCTRKLHRRAVTHAPLPQGSVYFGDWSPDGKYVAYSVNHNIDVADLKKGALWDIFVTRVKDGTYVQLTFDHANNKQPEFFTPHLI